MSGGDFWEGLAYGAMERLLAGLHGTTPAAIRTRFRKLRLKPFPDDIRAGIGTRVEYDLSRVLALAAVFELNRLYVPQGHAMDMVSSAWPEWCRALIAAAADLGLLPRPASMPATASSNLRIVADAFRLEDRGPELMITEQVKFDPLEPDRSETPSIGIDLRRIVAALAATVGTATLPRLGRSFEALERSFGWSPSEVPHRSTVSSMRRGRGFLEDGPFFERAEALLSAPAADFDAVERPLARRRLQSLMSYVEEPAPVDRWKAEIGSKEDRPRLKHLINAWAVACGLKLSRTYPPSIGHVAGVEAGELALRTLREAKLMFPRGSTDR